VESNLISLLFSSAVLAACSTADPAESEPTSDAATPDAASCVINVADFDQSCTVDSDCVGSVPDPNGGDGIAVQSGNYCTDMCVCGGGSINRGAAATYASRVLKTPLFSGQIPDTGCFCPGEATPCCLRGVCTVGCP
jgi:hypothetical protein